MTVEGPDENVSICCNSSVVIETLLNIKQSQRWMGLLSNYPILKNRTKKEGTHNMAGSQGFSVKDKTAKASTWWIGIIKCERHSVGSPQFLNSGRSSHGNVDSYQTVLELTVCGEDRSHGQ